MFKFFPDENELSQLDRDEIKLKKELRSSAEIDVKQIHYDIAAKVPVSVLKNAPVQLKHIRVADLHSSSYVKCHPEVKSILESTSDLLSGEYEGGFKIWECTFDLLNYLNENSKKIGIGSETKVLDLGCGSGLLGLYTLAQGASVVFQDYNVEVLDFLSIPNTIVNFGDEGLAKCRYFSGEWGSFHEFIRQRREMHGPNEYMFDFILSSETIYNTEYLPNFLSLIKSCLKPFGSLYVAAKTCYFGVGGGITAFTSLIDKDNTLKWEAVEVIRDGIQREILHIRSKSSLS